MQINHSLNHSTNYVVNGNNQPLLRNIGLNLEQQYNLNRSTMYRFIFTLKQESFALTHLYNTNRPVYEKIMGMAENYTGV